MDRLIRVLFRDERKASAVKREIFDLGHIVVHKLENHFHDMCELALDIAVDRRGEIWLLEINPKPAREVFRRIGEHDAYRRAIVRPLEYARWLYNHSAKTGDAVSS